MTNTSKAQFAHLHSHTDHSVLDGHASVKELAAHVHASGQPGYAVTDHGTMSNVYNAVAAAEAISKATGDDFRCMPGIEAYVVPGDASRHTREPIFFSNASHSRENKEERSNDVSGGGAYTHMTMLAETSEGMHNLFRLNTLAWHEGIHRKPRMDIQSISEYSKGVIATTGCPSGELQTRLRLGQWKEAIAYAAKMQDIFGKDNYYLELMDHNMSIDLERRVRGDLMKVAKELSIPLLATNDLHYVKREDAQDHEHMLCIQSGSSMLDQPYDLGGKRFAFEGEEYYAKTADEMLRLFPQDQYPDAVQNAANIVKRSSAKFEYNPELRPSVPLPDGHDEHSYLREMVYEGLQRKRPDKVNDQEYIDRIEKELGVLREKNFSGYMLVVSDFMRWAKAQGWHCGPGRGCLDGSTMIPTTMGHKRLDEVQVGDKVYDQSGDIIEVPAVFEWDCDEDLIEISTYYGGAPLKMTSDHKVLVSKANRVTSKTKITRGYVFEKEPLPLEWVRADEIEVGDLVVSPKLKVEEEFTGINIEPVSIAVANIASPLSVRSIVRETNLARSTVMRFFKGEKLGEDTKAKIQNYLNDHNSTIEDAIAIRTKTSVLDLEDTFIPANHDLGFVMGLFISDGWFRSKGHEIGFAQNRSEDEGIIPDVFKRVFGTDLIPADHASGDLRQYRTSHQGVVAVFKNLFPDYAFTAQSKYIPAILMNSNEEFRRGLLEGLWYGDGCFSGKTVYSTVSRRLAYGVHGLLGTLGIHSGITENIRRESRPEFNVAGRDSYTEYKVISAQEFDETRVINGMGIPYNGEFMYNRVRKIGTVPSSGKVYDFRVDTTNSYATESFVVHNSGGGSSVAFFTDIVEIDPIPHGLIFERFLNPERDSPPDIDSDFDDVNREKVIEYVRQKYGEEMVAMIITFGVIKAKSAIKDIARIYEEPFSVGETLTKALPAPIAGKEISLKEVFDKNAARYPEAEQFRDEARKIDNKNLIPFALGIEGKMRQTGVHAAGVIMSSKPLKDSIPLMMRAKDQMTITQFDYPTCEDLGLIKMDFLGLRNLTVIDKAINAIERNHGIKLVPQEIYDSVLTNPDQMTFDIINAGRTLGIFQLDSVAIAALARLIHVTSFNDISAILALYRPGPMGMESHTKYADRKNGREAITPIHPDLAEVLESILGETYGLVVFQEQIQFIAQKVADYSLGQADILRRAMGKKKKSILDAEFIPFSEGMKKNGYKDDAIQALWDTLVPFSEYGFNKSHSAAYALLSYLTAYLKAHYGPEFMAANLSTLTGDKDKTASYLAECRHMGITVLPPDVSRSTADYTATPEGTILVGLEAIRGVGHEVSNSIFREAAENGEFQTLDDFMSRAPYSALSKGVLEGLSHSGALDRFGFSRRALHTYLPDAAKGFAQSKKKQDVGQFSLFDMVEEADAPSVAITDMPEYVKKDKLMFERHALGLYVSDHPLSGIANMLERFSDTQVADVLSGAVKPAASFGDRQTLRFAGVANNVIKKQTRAGGMFGTFELEDITGSIPCLIFPKAFERLGHRVEPDNIYMVTGQLLAGDGEDDVKFAVNDIEEIELTESGLIPFNIDIRLSQAHEDALQELERLLRSYPGEMPVYLNVTNSKGELQIFELGDEFRVASSKALVREVQNLFGLNAV